jgi:hypothetical protein
MISTPNHTRTDLRTLADRARDVQVTTADDVLRAQAEAVEAVLRVLTCDAPSDDLTFRVTNGGL